MSTPTLPTSIVDHVDGCACPRCKGLEPCHVCGRIKLDIDWCFACRRFVLKPQLQPWQLDLISRLKSHITPGRQPHLRPLPRRQLPKFLFSSGDRDALRGVEGRRFLAVIVDDLEPRA